ncbi:tetratricopeptide repeat protein [Nocardia asiatica]|uniref:tetratricopeptide repeat protein n=1 Tax=Nocardia asiatica TaxID=209252 RepID=UPI0024565758|nr:tetratricopeptide repeat protein [Nocardia asiatica]
MATHGGIAVGTVGTFNYHAPENRRRPAVVQRITANWSGPSLVGRTSEVAQLTHSLGGAQVLPCPAAVTAIVGPPGVGKSELARHAGHAAATASQFEHVLFVDMHGYDPDPDARATPESVYGPILIALGIPHTELPSGAPELAATYHAVLSQLAATDARVLLILDNVSETQQTEGLLPGDSDHRVIVTSRETLADLPNSQKFEVQVLAPEAAIQLVVERVRSQVSRDSRAADDPEHARELVRLCGYLPLALQIVAALLAEEPGRSIAHLVADLAAETSRLSGLVYEDVSVRAAFELSYRRLADDIAELFRLLPAAPGDDVGIATAAALINDGQVTTRRKLMRLVRAHLIEGPVCERWRMHDLIRLYARELAEQDPSATKVAFARAVKRIGFDVASAGAVLMNETVNAANASNLRVFTSAGEAAEWFEVERRTIVAMVDRIAELPAYRSQIEQIARPICMVLEKLRFIDDWVTVASIWTNATAEAAVRPSEALARSVLASALRAARRFDESIAMNKEALHIYESLGDRHGEGIVLNDWANVLADLRRYEEAIPLYRRDISICHEAGDHRGEASSLNNLAAALMQIGRTQEATEAAQHAAALFHQIGDEAGQGRTLNRIGEILQGRSIHDQALSFHRRAADIFHQIGDEHAEIGALSNAATAMTNLRQFLQALEIYERVLHTSRATDNRHLEAMTLDNIGLVLARLERYDEAIAIHAQSSKISSEIEDLHGEGRGQFLLASALRDAGRIAAARSPAQRSLMLFERAGAPEAEQVRRLLRELGETDS